MQLLDSIKDQIKKHALKENPKECCGFILTNEERAQVYECLNFSPNPNSHFSINPKDYIKASAKGKIIAVYHSHPCGTERFSPHDLLNSSGHSIPFIVYSIPKDCFSIHDPSKNKTYIDDKPFEFGVSDCYNFVIDYYKELGIDLIDYPKKRNSEWQSEMPNLANKIINLNKSVYEINDKSSLKENDILLFKMVKGKQINHAAIYLKNNNIIHRPRNKNVIIEKLSNSRLAKISKVYRACQI